MLAGRDWKNLFDVVIVEARKPRFFTDESRPIRVFDENSGTHLWDRVVKLGNQTNRPRFLFLRMQKVSLVPTECAQ